ncbi:hypothetical protein PLICRDRAFT_168657 [Plicaturopsis crispa FD-325 SS-3]|uniref:Cytochrome P450 monooxygenase pc-3 n=1 Tax=Plicaturopsis crispa FD-325 SS-3 TaxID=944288 RepID=A0A0C9T6R4_PLICR|nr:hypothetical protein PLICRDRAFT_168657 [Plicaturopsis crispa FD-325 SS-3]
MLLLATPLIHAVRVVVTSFRRRREAAAMGARPAPVTQGNWIGNVDLLLKLLDGFLHGYPSDGQDVIVEKFGTTVNFRVLWEDLIFTVDPENIKTILSTDFNNYVKGETFGFTTASLLGSGVFNSDGEMWKFHRSMTRPFFTRDRVSDFDNFEKHSADLIEQMKHRLRGGYAIDFQDAILRFTLDSATEFLFGNCVHSLATGLPYPSTGPPYPSTGPPHPSTGLPYPSSYPSDAQTPLAPPSDAHTPPTRAMGPTNANASGPAEDFATGPAEDFAQAFQTAQHLTAARLRSGWTWPLLELLGDKTARPMRVVGAFVEPILREAIDRQRQRVKEGINASKTDEVGRTDEVDKDEVGEDETLLDHLVRQTSDPVLLKDEILNIMIAGRDTTAATLTFIIYSMAMYPAVLQRLREEILAHVGPSQRPTYDQIREMKYLRAVINETLRLYPPVPFNIRESINATTWKSPNPLEKPFYIPPKTPTSYSVFMMHRRTDLWGPDAMEFDPDRFIDHRLKTYLSKNPFIFLPFNAGPRICLGQQFAYTQISYTLIRIFQHFASVALAPDAQPPYSVPPPEWKEAHGRKGVERVWPKVHLTMYAHGGLWVRMEEAAGAGAGEGAV